MAYYRIVTNINRYHSRNRYNALKKAEVLKKRGEHILSIVRLEGELR